MVTMSIPDDVHAQLKQLAEQRGSSIEDVIAELAYAARSNDEYQLTPEQEAEVVAGMDELERGDTVSGEEVMEKLRALRR